MSFVELAFPVLLLVTLIAYHGAAALPRLRVGLLFLASLVFYAWWDWRFLSLLMGSLVLTFGTAILLERSRRPVWWLTASIGVLLAVLVYFKYADFFLKSFSDFLSAIGLASTSLGAEILLPIGISFYTFQCIAYMVDVHRKELPAERDFVKFGAFMIFFPQLVAGPIERAAHLLRQFDDYTPLRLEAVRNAIALIAYGYFMKVGIADVLAPSVQLAFSGDHGSGYWTAFGVWAFGLQIYGDFLGYSLIAKGVALLFGINLVWNFRQPYFSTSIAEFWRRWHISLGAWLRDYVYIPMGGSRQGAWKASRNLLATMIIGGFWHGANWTFVAWGLVHGVALGVQRLWNHFTGGLRVPRAAAWLLTMGVVFCGWLLFRATSLGHFWSMLATLTNWEWWPAHGRMLVMLTLFSGLIYMLEKWQITSNDHLAFAALPTLARTAVLSVMIAYTLVMSRHAESSFIYFQF